MSEKKLKTTLPIWTCLTEMLPYHLLLFFPNLISGKRFLPSERGFSMTSRAPTVPIILMCLGITSSGISAMPHRSKSDTKACFSHSCSSASVMWQHKQLLDQLLAPNWTNAVRWSFFSWRDLTSLTGLMPYKWCLSSFVREQYTAWWEESNCCLFWCNKVNFTTFLSSAY